jgi:hypothetical protein
MRGKQRGMTLIGVAIGLIVFCFFAYMGMVLGPAYSEYFGVKKAMNTIAGQFNADSNDLPGIQRALQKQFDVGYVDSVTGKNIQLLRDKGGNQIAMDYEVRKGFVYNIDFVVKFKYQVALGNKDGGD